MTEQSRFHMPATGEGWRHYKGGLYTIIGMSRDDKGDAVVVYTDYGWGLAQLAPIYNQRIDRFIQEVSNGVPRFEFEREVGGDTTCPYIRRGP